ncbi:MULTISPECIES: hypothetical protein [Nocardia]|uniref:hypothetical protein n=1 Tax=Nocardia TaxID=1817 RepID=UPI001300948F|nr:MULTISPECIES: hypothetical protein [Nocardia]
MGTYRRPTASHRSSLLRPAIVVLGGAVCAAVAGTTPAVADDQPGIASAGQLPFSFAVPAFDTGLIGAIPFGAPPTDAGQPLAPAEEITRIITDALGMPPEVAAPAPAAWTDSTEPMPAMTAVDEPEPNALPQANEIRVGNIELSRPSIVPAEQAAQINAGAAEVEDVVSDVLDSNGVDQARSDEMAARMVGDAAVGAVIGGVVVAPVAAAVGAVVGGVAGFVFGIPFLPTGLVVGPVVGATMVAALVAVPAVLAGAVIGAGVGAVDGWNAPLDPPPPAG